MATTPIEAGEQLFERVQELQERLDAHGDPATRELADELVSALVQMYGAGLEAMLGGILASGVEGERLAVSLSEDPFVATLLLIHDLHPIPLSDRVQGALDSVRPYMESHGGDVELLSLVDGVARIHLRGSCSDCSASSVTLELAIKQALEEAAPDLVSLEVEGVAPQMTGLALPMSDSTLEELPVVMAGGGSAPPVPSWVELEDLEQLADGALASVMMPGQALVVANVEGTLLAFQDVCADCGGELHGGALTQGALACPRCERSYFLPRAGRSMDDEQIQLTPVPLLREQDRVKVALAV